jgi:hypothetical protein
MTPDAGIAASVSVDALARCARLAPRPTSIEETGLSRYFLTELVAKHLSSAGVLDVVTLAKRLRLPGSVVEDVLAHMRTEALVELRTSRDENLLLRFGLTDRGRALAGDALQRDGYRGPAPIPIERYRELIQAQAIKDTAVTRERVHEAFSDTVIRPDLLDSLGPAMSSGRSLFIYGHPGTGKSFIARRLTRLLGPPVLVPHSVIVGDSAIEYFDPSTHRPVPGHQNVDSALFAEGFDARFVFCERPFVSCGGELTGDMLELQYDVANRRYRAPLQMRANLGMLLIDDLGRQRIATADLFNRWIVPLEEKRDQLTLHTGQHFSTPFELVLVFSTNLDPHKLADDAFLRRIGYKIHFQPSSPTEYSAIWRQFCEQNAIEDDGTLLSYALEELYPNSGAPRLACHPRDLLGLARDYQRYAGESTIGKEGLDWAWRNYFVQIESESEGRS